MPLQATSGAASYDAFGGGVAAVPNFIEEVFSTFLASADGTNTIVNGIDLSTYGGMVWHKTRSAAYGHDLRDSARGFRYGLEINTGAQFDSGAGSFTANTNGFFDTYDSGGNTDVWWTFRKQPKFFDVVTYTGTGSNTTIAHSLGSVPGSIIVKRTDTTAAWAVYHRSLANTQYLVLNTTAAAATGATWWNSTTPTSSVFSIGTDASVNASGGTYVAYLFAHDAGGFGLTGTDNVISCGSFSGASLVTLGYEPQWVLSRRIDTVGDWRIFDTMRGFDVSAGGALLSPNRSDAETVGSDIRPSATGFTPTSFPSGTNIYIAIRRGPMKVPTLGTSVFSPIARSGTNAVATVTTTNLPDTIWSMNRAGATGYPAFFYDRLRGANTFLIDNTGEEIYDAANSSRFSVTAFNNLSYALGIDANYAGINGLTSGYSNWVMSRAPGFFDEVCYTGPGTVMTVNHNLQVVPELMIVKPRSASGDWIVYSSTLGATAGLYLNLPNNKYFNSSNWNDTSPTSSVFTVGANGDTNFGNRTYVAYLFATCAGVSKVGSYTGTGTTKQIDCGFTAGARFVLIKRTDSTGDWYVWDSARGIIAGNDSYLLLNSTAAEVTSTDYIDTYSAGFEISSTAPAAINASAGTFIFLAIA
jgi:hypothetical protein